VRSASIVSRRLTTGCMVVCATPEFLAEHGTPVHPDQLAEHPYLSLSADFWGDERVFTGPQGEVRVRPNNVMVANNTEMLRQMTLHGMGIATLPSYLVGRDMARGKLVRLLPEYKLSPIEINIAYPSRRHLPAKVRTFIDHLVEHFTQTANGILGEQWLKDGSHATDVSRPEGVGLSTVVPFERPVPFDNLDAPVREPIKVEQPVVSRKAGRAVRDAALAH